MKKHTPQQKIFLKHILTLPKQNSSSSSENISNRTLVKFTNRPKIKLNQIHSIDCIPVLIHRRIYSFKISMLRRMDFCCSRILSWGKRKRNPCWERKSPGTKVPPTYPAPNLPIALKVVARLLNREVTWWYRPWEVQLRLHRGSPNPNLDWKQLPKASCN